MVKVKNFDLIYRRQRADVSPAHDVAVGELEEEEDCDAAPDGDVVVHRPVCGVKSNLKCWDEKNWCFY